MYKASGSIIVGVDHNPEKGWMIRDIILPPYIGDILYSVHAKSDSPLMGELELCFDVTGEDVYWGKYPEEGEPGWEERTPSVVGVYIDDDGNDTPLSEGVTEHLFELLHEYIMEAPIDE